MALCYKVPSDVARVTKIEIMSLIASRVVSIDTFEIWVR